MPSERTSKIPIEDVAKYPLPGMARVPTHVRADPSGTMLTYLYSPDGSLTRQLFAHNPQTGDRQQMLTLPGEGATEDNLSLEEKLRRERMRERGLGITSYAWAKDTARVMVPVRGDVWIQDGMYGTPRKVAEGGAIDPQITRDGRWVAFVKDHEVYVVSAEPGGGAPVQITSGARGTGRTHGLAEYAAQEEMGRLHGFWWNNAGDALAYTEVDETHIPVYRIVHQGEAEPGFEDHRYPFAGADNAKLKLGIVARTGGETTWVDLRMDGEDEIYLARVHWMPDGSLVTEIENRAQTRTQLMRYARGDRTGTVLVDERSEVWINLHEMFEPLEHGKGETEGAFVWASERTGFRHLYLFAADGKPLRQLTHGEWMVTDLVGVDEQRQLVWFVGTKDGPTERHLYRVPLAGGALERLTEAPGIHSIDMDRTFSMFTDAHTGLDQPPSITIRSSSDGQLMRTIDVPVDPRVAELGLTPPELVTLPSGDGVTLHGAIYRPGPEAGPPPWPTIVSVYGGPHAQRVTNSWELTVDMRAQYLRGLGYLVFRLDNRGSAGRGLAFEGAIKNNLGDLEVRDQKDGVAWLVGQGLTDPERVGIYGWSYGGYMTAMALLRAPETFKVGIAGAMVSSWDGYDTHYTERYMGTPSSNAAGYASSSAMTHVDALAGHLMIVHGLIDENVHFRHAARFIDALIKARKPYELLLFPGERHMPRSERDRVYMEERMRDFFDAHLRRGS